MKKIGLTIGFIAIILLAVGFGMSKYTSTSAKDKVYTMQEALTSDVYTAKFDVEEKSLTVSQSYIEGDGDLEDLKIKRFSISKEDEQALIKEIEAFKLIKYNDINITDSTIQAYKENKYFTLYLTISTGYKFKVNTNTKVLYVLDENIAETYKIQDSDKFFALLEKIKEAPAK